MAENNNPAARLANLQARKDEILDVFADSDEQEQAWFDAELTELNAAIAIADAAVLAQWSDVDLVKASVRCEGEAAGRFIRALSARHGSVVGWDLISDEIQARAAERVASWG